MKSSNDYIILTQIHSHIFSANFNTTSDKYYRIQEAIKKSEICLSLGPISLFSYTVLYIFNIIFLTSLVNDAIITVCVLCSWVSYGQFFIKFAYKCHIMWFLCTTQGQYSFPDKQLSWCSMAYFICQVLWWEKVTSLIEIKEECSLPKLN